MPVMPVDAPNPRLNQRRPLTAGDPEQKSSARRHSRGISKKIEGQLLEAFRHAHPSTSEAENLSTRAEEIAVAGAGSGDAPTISSNHQNSHLSRRRASRRDSVSLLSNITTALASSTSATRRPSTSPSSTRSPTTTTTPSISSTSSYFSSQAPSSDFEARSPTTKNKKGPASHSSHGIETATGPPPALSTQRSYTNDPARRAAQNSADFAFAQQQLVQIGLVGTAKSRRSSVESSNDSTPAPSHDDGSPDSGKRDSQDTAKLIRDSPLRFDEEMNDRRFRGYGEDLLGDDRDRTLRALEGIHHENRGELSYEAQRTGGTFNESGDGDQQQAGNEDLFLNLARADSTRRGTDEVTSRSERRRSRIALASHRQSLPPTSFSSPLTQSALREANVNNQDESPLPNPDSQEPRWSRQHSRRISQTVSPTDLSRRASLQRSYAASAHPLDEPQRLRYPADTSRLSFSAPRSALRDPSPEYTPTHERKPSLMTPSRRTSYRQSNLSYSAPRDGTVSSFHDRPPGILEGRGGTGAQFPDGTESTASTTAPSTVWDELDDMKSRIRKLELTGKLPPSSGAAMTQAIGERPRTATTTVTTISSSPRRGRHDSISPSESMFGGPVKTGVHPLLQSALVKSKPLLNQEVYRLLDAAAQDALSLAAMANTQQSGSTHSQSQSGGPSSPSITDRLARRKADSICRNLTDLCIALSDGRIEAESLNHNLESQSTIRPISRDASTIYNSSFQAPAYKRANSGDRDLSAIPRASPSALSRLEARRSSLLATNSNSNSPRTSVSTPTAPNAQNNRGLNRSSTLIRRREVGEDEEEREFRPISRAATDAGYRTSPRERISREYTSQHPLPDQRSPSVQSNLPLRRHFASSSLSNAPPLPSTPAMLATGGRRYLERSGDRDGSVTGTPSDDRTERGSVLGQYDSGTPGRRGSLGASGSVVRKLRAAQFTDSPPVPSINERDYQ